MSGSAPGLQTLPHAVFLHRLAGASRATSVEAQYGRAAFVTLRLVDLLGAESDTLHPDAFRYQKVATTRACRGLPSPQPETSHLLGLIESAASAFRVRDNRLMVPSLFAYAHYLEDEMRLEEALDVLETVERVAGEALRPADRVAVHLRCARVLRKLNRFDLAEQAYAAGRDLAAAIGDGPSERLGRLGQAETLRGRGNLYEAEHVLRGVLADSEYYADWAAHAQARHILAVILSMSGRVAEAIPHAWRAYQLYDDDLSRMRILGDLGVMLLTVGDPDGAERALAHVLGRGATRGVEDNALIELMHCASYRRDQVGFERWRERCEQRQDDMPPNVLVDYLLKLGIGRARFGQYNRATTTLARALKLAEDAGLHEATFRLERLLAGIPECKRHCAAPELVAEPECGTAAVREVSASLGELGRLSLSRGSG